MAGRLGCARKNVSGLISAKNRVLELKPCQPHIKYRDPAAAKHNLQGTTHGSNVLCSLTELSVSWSGVRLLAESLARRPPTEDTPVKIGTTGLALPSLTAVVIMAACLATPAFAAWSLVWSDEFNGTSLNAGNWTHDIGTGCPSLCGWGNNELQYYRSQNVTVTGGNLVITSRPNPTAARRFTSGKVTHQGQALVPLRPDRDAGQDSHRRRHVAGVLDDAPGRRLRRLGGQRRDRHHGVGQRHDLGRRRAPLRRQLARRTPTRAVPTPWAAPTSPTTSTSTPSSGSPTRSAGTWTASST